MLAQTLWAIPQLLPLRKFQFSLDHTVRAMPKLYLAIQGRSIGSLLSVKIWSVEDCQIQYRRTGQIFSTENGALYVRTSWLYVFLFGNLRLAGDCHFSEILNYFSQFTIKGLQIFKIPSTTNWPTPTSLASSLVLPTEPLWICLY